MATIQEQVASLGDLAVRVPAFVYEQDRILLMAFSAAAAGLAVGTVVRNHEIGPLAKFVVAGLIFAGVLGVCLLATYAGPILYDMARHARSAGT